MALGALNKETFFSEDETVGHDSYYRLTQFDYAGSLCYNTTSNQSVEPAQTSLSCIICLRAFRTLPERSNGQTFNIPKQATNDTTEVSCISSSEGEPKAPFHRFILSAYYSNVDESLPEQ